MIEITPAAIAPENVIAKVKSDAAGCVVTYVGLIRGHSNGKKVASVTYLDEGKALKALTDIVAQAQSKYRFTRVAITHRTGVLKVGDINLVIAVAASHRREGFAACRYIIDEFKKNLPTRKTEIYENGSVYIPGVEK